MLIIVFSAPLGFLGLYLAWLCWRRRYYRQALAAGAFASVMFCVTLGVLGAVTFPPFQVELSSRFSLRILLC